MEEEKLTQKWCVVALLEDLKESYSFHRGEWPLHITIAGVHDAVWDESQIIEFKEFIEKMSPFNARTIRQGILGTTAVVFVDKNSSLLHLHTSIIDFLGANGAIFNNPEWQKDGYIPHSTIQKHASVAMDVTLTVNNIALVDMFPDQDASLRKIAKIFKLKHA